MMEETEKSKPPEGFDKANNDTAKIDTAKNPAHVSPGQHHDGGGKSSVKKIIVAVVVLIIGGVLISYAPSMIKGSDTSQTDKKKKDRVVPINVATAGMQVVPIEVRSIGNVLAYSTVNVTPQVGGQLTKVHFTQGQLVKKNDLLFQIDPRQYQAALAQAEGNVAKDRAQIQSAMANLTKDQATIGQYQFNLKKDKASLAYANLEKGRYAMLVDQGVVSHEQSDQYNTNAATADATIQADMKTIENAKAQVLGDQAAIDTAKGTLEADQGVADNARLQLSWTTIRSPMDGRTSSLNVYQGNIVNATTMLPLATINQVDPIYVTVAVPEQYLNDLRRSQKDGTLKLQALIEGRKTDYVDGTISFMENTVNTSTGTITMRASFANNDSRLYPGQFVDVLISMPPKGPSVTVPTRCVQNTQQGTSVYIVQADNTVKLTTIKAGQASGDFTAVQEGVNVGDTVVTDGQLQLSPGAKVKIQKSPDDGQGSGNGQKSGGNSQSSGDSTGASSVPGSGGAPDSGNSQVSGYGQSTVDTLNAGSSGSSGAGPNSGAVPNSGTTPNSGAVPSSGTAPNSGAAPSPGATPSPGGAPNSGRGQRSGHLKKSPDEAQSSGK
jgi:multidrug efflux system membrane fusion protein